jgi:3-methyladenine DNA glycosylase AlkC
MEPFKERIGPDAVGMIADRVRAAWPPFPRDAFVAAALDGLTDLELKARVVHVARALRERLPERWADAVAVLVDALPPALVDETGLTDGFAWWPLLQVVEDFGADDPASSLPALREMTRRFSAEFAIRPLIDAHPEASWAALAAWVDDPDVHVRRLVSEGSRPRLPWGRRLSSSVADPSRGLLLLDRLVDDPSPYVRRSVANHLGDVAKDHPERAVAVAARWIAEDAARTPLVKHALRHPLKQGHPGALALLGEAGPELDVADVTVSPGRARVGGAVVVRARIVASEAGTVRVDVVWAWPSARGAWSSKVFRGASRALAAGEAWSFSSSVSLRPVSTRPLRLGTQRVWLRIGGRDLDPVTFELVAGDP